MKGIFNFIPHSIKFRLIGFTITIFMFSVLLSSIYLGQMLRKDMEKLLGHQQAATVLQVADKININFEERLNALDFMAGSINSSMLSNPAVLQAHLEKRPILRVLFNGGVYVIGKNGIGIADAPVIGRVGTNYSDRDYVVTPLNEGKPTVGKAVMGKRVGAPSFAMAVPIKDAQGHVIGVLAGSTDLSKPNFLTGSNKSRHGETGGFMVLDPKNNLIVTATSTGMFAGRTMKPLPAPDENPLLNKRIKEGFNDPAVNINSLGVETMTSSARIPFPGWILLASLPTIEAFAPIAQAQARILIATILIALIAGFLMWLFMTALLRQQFKPLVNASQELKQSANTNGEFKFLPISNRDEVGDLFASFNRLLSGLSDREKRFRTLFDEAADGIHILDMQGNLVQYSPSFAQILGYGQDEMRGMNVRDFDVNLPSDQLAKLFAELTTKHITIERVLRRKDGALIDASITIKRIQFDGQDYVYGSIQDVTQQKQDRLQLDILAASMAHTNDVVIITEAEPITLPGPRIVYVNDAFVRMTGYTKEEAIGNTPRMLQGTRSDPAVKHQIWDALSQWKNVRVEMINYTKDGREFWVELDITPIADANGWYTHWISIQRDITDRKTAEKQIDKLSLAVEQSLESVVVTDLQGSIEYVNEAFVHNTGYAREEVIGKNPRILQSGKTPRQTYQTLWESLHQGRSWKGEFFNRRKDGSEYIEIAAISPLRDKAGVITHYVASKEDVTEKKAIEARTQHMAFYDQLTDLPNRLLLLDRLRLALKSSNRSKYYGALLYIDLDNFKNLNDTLGHNAGDELLKQVATRLLSCMRESDTVARFGGDEFVVMLEGLSADATEAAGIAELIAKKVLDSFQAEFPIGQYVSRSSPSIGITLFSSHQGDVVEEILKQADLAMYAAKTAGRNTHRFFDQTMQTSVNARAVIEKDLRLALEQNRFCLHYQPQLNNQGEIVGAEALLRILHPERGLVAPGEFIKVAEQTGLIVPIGEWVLEKACEQLALWQTDPELAGMTLSVNVSAGQFHDPDFVEKVSIVLERTGANPQLLKLEPTESLLLENVQETIGKMAILRAKGVHFALDDFGTGYSSLSYLKKLPLDLLKIDQSFVRDLPQDPHACSIVRAIITLAKSLDLDIIAEGVETPEQRDYLIQNGCHMFQGYLFSRPISVDQFNQFVKNNQPKGV